MEASKNTNKEWLSPKEASKEFGLSISTLAKWRMDNKFLSFSKIGKYIKYRRSDIEAFLLDSMVSCDEVA